MNAIRVLDLDGACARAGLAPEQLTLARLTPTQIERLQRGDVLQVGDAVVTDLARALGVTKASLEAARPREAENDDTPAPGLAFDADPSDDVGVQPDAPADRPQPSAREAFDAEPTAPPMELALRAVMAASPELYRDEDLELVGAVLSQGEAPAGVSRRGLDVIARTWLTLAVGVRGMDASAVPAILAAADECDEPRVRMMAEKIRARVAAQARAAARSTTTTSSKKNTTTKKAETAA